MNRYSDIDPGDIDPDTGRPYSNYSSPSLDTSFHDGEVDVDDDEPMAATFQIGERVLWPNGVEGEVRGIDFSNDTLLDHCGGWHEARNVDKLT